MTELNEAIAELQRRSMKEGWMDSIDFDWEVGEALGGNRVFPSERNCRENKPCIRRSEKEPTGTPGVCFPKRVYVLDADKFDEILTRFRSVYHEANR